MYALIFGAFAAPPLGSVQSDVEPGFSLTQEAGPSAQVVGGAPAPPGSWQSTVAVMYGGMPGCTGTLVAPSVVITAAHCVSEETPSHVRTGSINAVQGGQLIPVSSATHHPSYNGYTGVDIAVLQLQTPSSSPTTLIATDCVSPQAVFDGAPAAIVGFGSTNPQGTQYPDVLYEALSSITDADCSQDTLNGLQTTCEPALRPAGELAAGGNGVDSCYGDSGGPLYVQGSDANWYLAGVTSRGFAGQDCGSGGVYVRPDTHLAWIEGEVGPLGRPACGQSGPNDPIDDLPAPIPDELPKDDDAVADGLVITSDSFLVTKNRLGGLELTAEGAAGEIEWSIVEEPGVGTANIDDGMLFYAPKMGWVGEDLVVVSALDPSGRYSEAEVRVLVARAGACDSGGGAPLASFLFALVALFGRARRA